MSHTNDIPQPASITAPKVKCKTCGVDTDEDVSPDFEPADDLCDACRETKEEADREAEVEQEAAWAEEARQERAYYDRQRGMGDRL